MADNPQGSGALVAGGSARSNDATNKAASVAADVKDEAFSAAADVKDEAAGAAVELKDQAATELSSLTGETRREATQLGQEARDVVTSHADSAARQLATTISGAGHELAQMAERSDQPDGPATQIVRQVATQTTAIGERLERDGYQGVTSDLARVGRNHPGLFLLGAGLTGFALGRLLRNTDTSAITDAVKEEATADTTPPAPASPAAPTREAMPAEQPMRTPVRTM